MYRDLSLNEFLSDLEDKNVEMGGGSLIGVNLAGVCSLIIYISNLTLGKEKYKKYEKQVNEILSEAINLKNESLDIIDKDKEILEEILASYKKRKEFPDEYEEVLKKTVDFGFEVLEKCMMVMEMTRRISNVGNTMLASDFEICAYNAYSAIESAITNININLVSFTDENYIEKMRNKYLRALDQAYDLKEEILKISKERVK